MSRILLTGAAGKLGTHLRKRFAESGRGYLATDIVQPEDGERVEIADLSDRESIDRLMANRISAVVHLGGMSREYGWLPILDANIVGTYNIFEAARKAGVSRVLFASTYHVMGMYPTDHVPLSTKDIARPDSLYAVSKLFGETLGRFYYDKFGVENLSMRICVASEPKTERDLHLYCDRDDLTDLIQHGLDVSALGCNTVFAISANAAPWYYNDPDHTLGWRPTRSSSQFALPSNERWEQSDPAYTRQGAIFANWGHFDDDVQT